MVICKWLVNLEADAQRIKDIRAVSKLEYVEAMN